MKPIPTPTDSPWMLKADHDAEVARLRQALEEQRQEIVRLKGELAEKDSVIENLLASNETLSSERRGLLGLVRAELEAGERSGVVLLELAKQRMATITTLQRDLAEAQRERDSEVPHV